MITTRMVVKIASAVLLVALPSGASAQDLAGEPGASTLRLRTAAQAAGESIRFADVLIFGDADAALIETLANEVVLRDASTAATVVITRDEVLRRLAELKVNRTRVLLGGALQCRVLLAGATPAAAPGSDSVHSGPAARTAPTLGPADEPTGQPAVATGTLAAAVRDFVRAELSDLGGDAELEFERAGREFLELTAPPWEFSVRSAGGERLGFREFRVALRRDGRLQRTLEIAARVRLVKSVLVAQRPLAVGTYIGRADLGTETRLFERESEVGLDRLEAVVGRQVEKFVPAGGMLRPRDTRPVELVRRARPVTITGADSGVRLRLSGVALDSGALGERVRVRLGESRADRREVRAEVTGLGTVRMVSDSL
ncbi:MAG: flagellar basal body P-ring formation chaperone FlgA [Phycisphaerae bacterium]